MECFILFVKLWRLLDNISCLLDLSLNRKLELDPYLWVSLTLKNKELFFDVIKVNALGQGRGILLFLENLSLKSELFPVVVVI